MTAPDGGPVVRPGDDGHAMSPGGGSSPSFQQCVASARAGELDTIFGLFEQLDERAEDLDELAYKLLNVAADFGHTEAADWMDDLLEGSSLRYDDDRFMQGNAHFELGLAYLRGTDGLPSDLDKGRAHLEKAHACHWPWHVREGETLLEEARALLSASQLAVFNEVYGSRCTCGGDVTEHTLP